MDAEKLKRVEEIYHAALEIKPAEREAFLAEVCGTDNDVRREVDSLLSFENSPDFLLNFNPKSLISKVLTDTSDNLINLIGKEIGRYKIQKLLGKGGMGEVFLAEDIELERPVAIKFLPENFAEGSSGVKRFTREAKTISALNHPNILTIYEVGKSQNLRFIVTEYIEGQTLREKIFSQTLDLRETLSIAQQIAAALSAAHSAGIIHRDIKPENIIVRKDDFVKVLDFGLAKPVNFAVKESLSDASHDDPTLIQNLTNPGMMMGTISYMSPEQIRGQPDIDARTDIWSLGVVIFEMLSRRTPFKGETQSDTIAAILKTEVPRISKLVENCPAELDRIISKTLQKKREERYQTVQDLAIDLKNLKRDLEFSVEFERATDGAEKNLTVQSANHTTEAISPPKRFPLTPILLTFAIIFAGIWWFFGNRQNTNSTGENNLPKPVEIVNWSSSPGEFYSVGSFSPDGKMIAFASTKSGKKNIWLKQTGAGESVQITKDDFDNQSPIWSPDGEQLAFFSMRGNRTGIWRMPKLGGSPKLISEVDDGGSTLRFWSKKDSIFYESEKNIYAVDVNSGQKKQITDLETKDIADGSINISPDEQKISYVAVEGEKWSVWLKDLNNGATKTLVTGDYELKNTVFHSDSKRIFYSALIDGTFQIFVTDINAAPPKQLTFAERDCFVLDVSSNGEKILYGSAKEESDVWKVDLKDRKESAVAAEIDSELWANVSPDGKILAYQSIKNLSQGNKIARGRILAKNLTSNEPPIEISSEGSLPVWSPDGQNLAFIQLVGDKFEISNVKTSSFGQRQLIANNVNSVNFTLLPYNRLQTNDFSWSPDSKTIAYISKKSGQQNVWLINSDGSKDTLLTNNNDKNLYLYNPIWSPDGKQIVYRTKTGEQTKKPTYGIWIINLETKISRMLTQDKAFSRLLGWAQTGKEIFLASTTDSETKPAPTEISLLRLDAETGKTEQTAVLKETYLHNIHLSPDGKTIAFAVRRSEKDNIKLIPATGGEEKSLTDNNDSRLYFSSLAWSPDGNSIYFGKQSRYSLLSMLSNFK